MKNKGSFSTVIIVIIAVVLTVISILLLWQAYKVLVNIPNPKITKDYANEPSLLEVNEYDKYTMRIAVPVINEKPGEGAGTVRCLSVIYLIQQVLEDALKANDEIILMAVYSEDGTILAHLKPERIGSNMFDVDVELGDSRQEIYEAMRNRKICMGLKYDPILNDNIRFIIKPLQIGNLDHNLSLLIGFSESYVLRETRSNIIPASIAGAVK